MGPTILPNCLVNVKVKGVIYGGHVAQCLAHSKPCECEEGQLCIPGQGGRLGRLDGKVDQMRAQAREGQCKPGCGSWGAGERVQGPDGEPRTLRN